MTERERFTGWRTSSRSGGYDNCVEVGVGSDGSVGVRDSKDRAGTLLSFAPRQWADFIADVRAGRLDA